MTIKCKQTKLCKVIVRNSHQGKCIGSALRPPSSDRDLYLKLPNKQPECLQVEPLSSFTIWKQDITDVLSWNTNKVQNHNSWRGAITCDEVDVIW